MMGFARSADALMNEAHDGHKKTLERLAEIATGKSTSGAITGLLEDWKRATEPARKTIMEAESSVRRFNELHPDLDANEITPEHVRDFRSALLGMPKHVSKKVAALPLPSLVKWAEENQAPLITPQSAVKMLRLVKAILANADDAGLIESNPAAGITIKSRATAVERLPFDAEQIQDTRQRPSRTFWRTLRRCVADLAGDVHRRTTGRTGGADSSGHQNGLRRIVYLHSRRPGERQDPQDR